MPLIPTALCASIQVTESADIAINCRILISASRTCFKFRPCFQQRFREIIARFYNIECPPRVNDFAAALDSHRASVASIEVRPMLQLPTIPSKEAVIDGEI